MMALLMGDHIHSACSTENLSSSIIASSDSQFPQFFLSITETEFSPHADADNCTVAHRSELLIALMIPAD
ncbi:unnamed protein product [Litomosoides sigmodontis]|uniref:Uncharacterized protein n=1 Tax=Litomosoides sigmodontis TaxID=42156 RepID=A0A3P6SIJ4_LITSI|nr:unnamed protein product [Litomosoides sigmodontis]